MRLSSCVLLLILSLSLATSTIPFLKIMKLAESIIDLVGMVAETWEIINDFGHFVDMPKDRKEDLIFSKIDNINLQLNDLDEKIGGLQNDVDAITRTLKNLPETLRYQLLLEKLRDYQVFINMHYDKMQKYVRDIEFYENSTLIDFSNSVVSHSDSSVTELVGKMYTILVESDFLKLTSQQLKQSNGNLLCHEQSPQQIYYNILNKIMVTNSKGYIMTQFAYMIKKLYGQGNFSREAEDATEEFKSHTDEIIETVNHYMSTASTEVWKCDPERHISGETYVEITNLVQGYIQNKVNLDPKGKCWDSCDSFHYTKTQTCRNNKWCQQQPACPKLVNCKSFDDEMTNATSGRRYDYVEHGNGRIFGKKKPCTRQNRFDLEGYKEWLIWECSYCFCLCDGGNNKFSDRFINLRAAFADLKNNMVVTGVRFVKHNRIIHLQIQEGKLLPSGQIDRDTVKWVPPEDYKITDRFIYEGQDYHTLSWEKRAFELNTVTAPNGSVITGTRFARIGGRIELEVLATPFNFTTGQLRDPNVRSAYYGTPHVGIRHKFGTELQLQKPDIPTRSTSPSTPVKTHNKYVRLVNTDYDKDAAQTTVPYFDAQPVESLVPVPLSGVGIYYKGLRGFGGFIAPKIFTYDFSQHLDVIIWIAKAWNVIEGQIEFSEVPFPLLEKTERKLFAKIDMISTRINELSVQVDAIGTNTISMMLNNLPERIRLELRLNDLLNYHYFVGNSFHTMQKYVNHREELEKATLKDFADNIVSHDSNSVVQMIESIYTYVVPEGKGINNRGILGLLTKSLKFRYDFLNLEDSLWNLVAGLAHNQVKEDHPEVTLIREFERFGDKIQETLPHDVNYGLQVLEGVWTYAYAYTDLRGIYALYETFRRFQPMQTGVGRVPAPRQAWVDLTRAILDDPKNSIDESLTRLHQVVEKKHLFDEARKEVEGDMLCNAHQSPQQVLFSLYNAIALTELKGYTMIQFAYMLKRLYGEGNFTTEAEIARERFQERTNNIIEAVKSAMQESSRDLWKCDPKRHVLGETYEEITQLLQGYIQNEVDLNPEGTCRENCAEYTYTKSHGCYKNQWCQRQRRCHGKVINCKYVDSDMWVCPSSDSKGSRRYEYVEYENGRVLGRKQGCRRGTTKVDSWWRWLFWHCSYCFCLCDEQGALSDRYVNLRAATANIQNNMVVTGLRFVKHNRIIHLQIQEGKLLPRGNIDLTTIHWVPVEEYKITDRNVFNSQDYHTLTWEKRVIDLDDLVADDGYLVTGVRFKMIGSHLNFEIMTTPFDFETGQLIDPESKSLYKDNPNTDSSLHKPRTRVRLINPDIPTRSPSPSLPDSKTDQYVEFTNTDLDRDAAQTTVPFFDAQPVESLQPVPLSGAGIFHKGQKNFGGFVAPKLITYDFSKHLQIAFPEEEPAVN
ncbi:uncharacterized protein BDFB_003195 [Asbolus verrucosus]|uniref:Uncharacterized protein n=1 Tax=Asbolus verrucosus TaxID=1661398 RepID=A0A482VZF9_ASBVE|nr:uncharacterized protein BDFB_003195 [Asbolus verrucosus]